MRQIGYCIYTLACLAWAQSYFLHKDSHQFIGGSAHQVPTCATNDSEGRIYIGGYQYTEESPTLPDGWIVCLDSKGELQWTLTPGGIGPDKIEDIVVGDSLIYFCGITGSALSHPEEMPLERRADFWVGVINKHTGRLLWQVKWGSSYIDMALTLCLTPYRTLMVGGFTWEDPQIGMQAAIYILQARTGEILHKQLWGKGPSLIRRIRPVATTPYYACIGEQGYYPFVGAVDYLGQIYWRTVFQFHGFPSQLSALYPTGNGRIFVGGRYNTRWGIAVLDYSGRVIWEKLWPEEGPKGTPLSLTVGQDGLLYVTGKQYSHELTSQELRGGEDVWLAALTPDGKLLWERSFGGPYDEYGVALISLPKTLLIISAKENRFKEPPAQTDAWLIWLKSVNCDSIPVEVQTDAPSLKEKAGRPIRFWMKIPPHYAEEKVLWDFGDGATATGKEVSHIYGEPGTYTVQAIISFRYGCQQLYLPPLVLRISRP
ncbi:MAG: PKD domain-containing protein [Bacteroidia bacterium]|nr:PKD domain-containing protein [Bacteroidia bacterium]MDW8133575.1 PKD domain-containing protein [Bacteroidia bacterium]